MVQAQKQTHRTMENKRDPEISPHSYSHLVLDKDIKNVFNKQCWKTGVYM
jgi:hypothetical protein